MLRPSSASLPPRGHVLSELQGKASRASRQAWCLGPCFVFEGPTVMAPKPSRRDDARIAGTSTRRVHVEGTFGRLRSSHAARKGAGEQPMRTLGMIGGMSWQSTMPYYDIANRMVQERLGGLHSAKMLLLSVDFAEIATLMHTGRWDELGERLASDAATLEGAGAQLLVLCTNTLHRVAPQIEARVRIPFLHIADASARELQRANTRRVGLLATRFTMEQDF